MASNNKKENLGCIALIVAIIAGMAVGSFVTEYAGVVVAGWVAIISGVGTFYLVGMIFND